VQTGSLDPPVKDDFSVAVSVLTHNRAESLAELMTHLESLATSIRQVIVVDNASTDRTHVLLSENWPSATCIRTDRNVGIVARNAGVLAAATEVVVTLDDDVVGLTPEDVRYIARRFKDKPTLGALNFRVVNYYTKQLCNWVHHRTSRDATSAFETFEITEGAVAFRRAAFEAAGGYHPDYFISHEGPDLAFRLMNRGYSVEFDGAVTVLHKHEERARLPSRFYFYDTRNLFLLASRTMPAGYALRYLCRGLLAMGWYSVRDGHLLTFLRGVYGGLGLVRGGLATREPWTAATRETIRRIDSHRPSFWSLAKKRLWSPAKRLNG
jgi:hypothetical protein